MAKLEYYKCNIIGGFRLSDLSQQVKQDEVIDLDEHIANTSKAVQAALKAGWLIKVKKPRAKKEDTKKEEKKEKPPKNANPSLGMSVPNAKTVNKSLETRQAEDVAQKVSSPDMKGNKKPKTLEPQTGVSIPDIQDVQKNARDRQKENLNNKDEIIKTTIVKQEDTIEKLAKNENMDEGLSVPDFDEKADDPENENPEVIDENVDGQENENPEIIDEKVDDQKNEDSDTPEAKADEDGQKTTTIRRKRTVTQEG